ncbi:hypothetical protein CHS0354_034005 [Potamilus streckersoni]|uniref:DAGKc domain-containing protein n=1 Tax=Potamilus streckersoni TaxID=2493646 RepID=A0AAE0VGX9_9BIVA|nr:hypothetical protein CHS0354_034005 [Potamilus streckersoni]
MDGTIEVFRDNCVLSFDGKQEYFSCGNNSGSGKHVCLRLGDVLALKDHVKAGTLKSHLVLHYVVQGKGKVLRTKSCIITGEADQHLRLKEAVDVILNSFHRPKRLVVFVNPNSGHRKAVNIFHNVVEPLFKLCDISLKVVETKRPGQPIELLENYDLRLMDGLVAIGGDGMFSECMNGLLLRLQKDAKVDYNNPDATLSASTLPIGIIPAGSGNMLVQYLHGTIDVETAVIKIILGDHLLANAVSIHQGRALSSYAGLIVDFGLCGDMMKDCEKFRWLGPKRYKIVPLGTILKRKSVYVEVEFIPEEPHKVKATHKSRKFARQMSLPASRYQFEKAVLRLNSTPEFAEDQKCWLKETGHVYGIDSYVVTQKEKDGNLVPYFGDGALHVWLTDKCSFSSHVSQLSLLQQQKPGCWDFKFIREIRCRGYRVKLPCSPYYIDDCGEKKLKKPLYINCDGEAMPVEYPEFDVRLHHNAVPVFGKVG